jgi:hypothetical protein
MVSRRKIYTCAFLFAGVGVTGCIEDELGELELEASPEQADDSAVGLADELENNNGATPYSGFPVVECSSHNVIGVLDDVRGAHCSLPGAPPLPSWQWHTMFDDFTPDLLAWTEAVPFGLGRYCIYEYVGPEEPNQEDYNALFSAIDAYPGMPIESVAPDCRGEVVQGGGLNDPSVTAELASAFHDAIQWIPGATLAPTGPNRRLAEVAIVDTVSQLAHDDPAIDSVNEHGEFMGDIVRDITCADPPDPDCEDSIRYHIAMPREDNEYADWDQGGNFGTMGDFAMSVVAAVGHWRMNRLADPHAPQRLVISASLEAPMTSDPNRGPVRALEEALYFAACNGAIVVAAAGNTTDAECGHKELDPLAPATYELIEAPDQTWCALHGYAPIDPFGFPVFSGPRPLVYAVGGLDGLDRAIPNARAKGMPALAAYAANATVATADGFTTPLTGTSVSTAVVAATASLVWSYAPELTPDEVMRLISDSGFETQISPNFDFTESAPRVRRASVCAALEAACTNMPPGHCPLLACDPLQPPTDGHLGGYFAAADAALADPGNVVKQYDADPGGDPVCVVPTWDEQIDPQPEHPACPACGLDSPPPPDPPDNDVLSMSIDSIYQGLVVDIKLVTYDGAGTAKVFKFRQDVIQSVNDPSLDVTQVRIDAPNTERATLAFTLANGSIQDGPVPVHSQ